VSDIGNAYSDEILHAAQLSPITSSQGSHHHLSVRVIHEETSSATTRATHGKALPHNQMRTCLGITLLHPITQPFVRICRLTPNSLRHGGEMRETIKNIGN